MATELERDLTRCGFANVTTVGGKVAALGWIENGVGMYGGLSIEGKTIRWETLNKFHGKDSLDRAKTSLEVWRISQSASEASGCM